MNTHMHAETMRKTGFPININMKKKMWVWYSAGHQRSLTRPNKHDHSSGQHKEHSVSAFVPQLWLPTQVQGNGNEKLKKEPRGLGGFNLSPWVSHNGMVTKIFMHIFSPWYCTYPLINLDFSDFGVMKNWLFFQNLYLPQGHQVILPGWDVLQNDV